MLSSPAGAAAAVVAGAADELRRSLSLPPSAVVGGSAPPCPSTHQRHVHSTLQSIRDASDPKYLFLRTAIELVEARSNGRSSSSVVVARPGEDEELLFHCVTGYRHVYLRTWRSRSKEFLDAVRDWTLHVGLIAPEGVPNVVRSACLGAAACFWKRGWPVDDDGDGNAGGGSAATAGHGSEGGGGVISEAEGAIMAALLSTTATPFQRIADRTVLFRYLESLLNAPFGRLPGGGAADDASTAAAAAAVVATRAASFLSSLLAEMGGSSNASADYNLSLERHRNARVAFEHDSSIDETLRIGMAALGNVASMLCGGGALGGGTETTTTTTMLDLHCAIVTSATETMGWEPCGVDGSSPASSKWETWSSCSSPASSFKASSTTLLRPPERWRDALIRPDLLGAIFRSHDAVRRGGTSLPAVLAATERLGRLWRQMLLQLSSIHGPVFEGVDQRAAYCDFLVDGTATALAALSADDQTTEDDRIRSETIDWLSLTLRLVENFKLEILIRCSKFPDLLRSAARIGNALLESSLDEVAKARGDVDATPDAEWKDEALGLVLECAALLGGDPWLLGSGTDDAPERRERRHLASNVLSTNLAPLYGPYVRCRVRIASLEEHFLTSTGTDVDEVRENIEESTLEEELECAASLGRLDLISSLNVVGTAWGECLPRLRGLLERRHDGGGAAAAATTVTPEGAATLEEARLLISCLTHLVTDENPGEAPAIPDAVLLAGGSSSSTAHGIQELVTSLTSLAEYQARRAAIDPSDPTLSPLLAETLLRFFERWAPAYVLPPPPSSSSSSSAAGTGVEIDGGVRSVWSTEESSASAIAFCANLCLHHHCHWPQEKRLQRRCSSLLSSLGRRGNRVRSILATSGPFRALARVHASTAGTPHCGPTVVAAPSPAPEDPNNGVVVVTPEMTAGYRRLPYDDRARAFTSLLVGYGDASDETSRSMLEGCLLGAVHAAFEGLVRALGNGQLDPHDVVARETACLCVEMYGGAARASELPEPDRIARFVTPSLPHLSGLMNYYAADLSVCEGLLRLFRDYAEGFATVLDREQCRTLLNASADLIRGYASHHCASRVVKKSLADLEEEQNYSDVLTAIQLLIHLGARDFVDFCGPPEATTTTAAAAGHPPPGGGGGIDSGQITDVVFFGLRQILPLMTSGLLQYPTLCSHYFSLAGFMVETYPEKVCVLPFDLFHGLLQSLLFGMSHSDPDVSKSSLRGIAGLAKEHLQRRSLDVQLAVRDDVLDECVRRLLEEVIFRSIVWDRLEPAGAALLPLAAADVNRFAKTANDLAERLDSRNSSDGGCGVGGSDEGRRLRDAFERLMKPETLSKVSTSGYEGRMNRLRFKKDFEAFARDVHSFLVVK